MDSKKIMVSTLILLAIMGSMATLGVSSAASSNAPVVVTGAYWYSQNSTVQVAPGDDYVPLFVQFDVAGSFTYVNASVNLSYYGGSPFSYSYISGPNTYQRTYYNLSFPTAGQAVTINQLVNVSSLAAKGVYEVALEVTTNSTPSTPFFETFKVSVLGTPQLTLVNYYTDPPVIYQDQKYVQLTAVVSNTGLGPAKNLQVYASSSSFSVLTSDYSIAYLPSGSLYNFTFLLNARDVSGQAPVTLHLGNTSYLIPLYLHNYGSLKITSSLPTMPIGSSSLLELFNITNMGNKTMYGLSVYLLSPSVISIHIPSSNPLAALTADNYTISELQPGQTATVTYIVDVSSSAKAQSYTAQIFTSWHLNNTAQEFTQTYNFNETVSPTAIQQFTSSLTFTPLNIGVLGFIIVLIIALVAVSARSRRLRKKLKASTAQKETPSLIHREIQEKKEEERKD